MATIQTVHHQFQDAFNQRDRMLAIRFGGERSELRPPPCSFLVQRVDITERLSTPLHAIVHGITPDTWEFPFERTPGDNDVSAHPDRFLGLPTGIIVRAESRTRTFHGVVTGARHLGDWRSQADKRGYQAIELTVESPLRLLDLRLDNRLFQERTTLQIVGQLLKEHRLRNEIVAETLRCGFPDRNDDSANARACRTQYQETDLEFIHRLLIEDGLNYVLRSEKGRGGAGNVWEIFEPGHDFGSELHATVSPFPRPGELELVRWHSQRRLAPGFTTARSHDYRHAADFRGEGTGRQNDGMGQRARGTFGHHDSLPPRAVVDPRKGMGVPALRRQWAHDMDAEVFEGETVAPLSLVRPLGVVGLDGARTATNAKRDHFLVTSQRILATASLAPGLCEKWSPLADEVRRRSNIELFPDGDQSDIRPLRVTFVAHPAGTPLVPHHPRCMKRPLPGPTTATVAGQEGTVVETDALGRIAVNFHWERRPDVAEPGASTSSRAHVPTRVRYVHPGAGDAIGMQCLPRVGDEVLIMFLDNDPDRPIAVGSVHNGRLGPPRFGGVSGLPADAALTGLRTGEHRGAGANEIVFDDTTGEVGLRLGTTTAKSELNLGHIASPRQGGEASWRGTGAELRTDGGAVWRAGQGVLISAETLTASAPHMRHDELSELLARSHELTRALSEAVARAGGAAATLDAQQRTKDALASWLHRPSWANAVGSAAEPLLAMHGREGIVAATAASQVLYAGRHIDIAADGACQLASGERLHIGAGQGVTMHACDGGIDMRAAKGTVRLESSQDEVRIDARQGIAVTSHDGEIVLSARIIRLVGGDGSFIRIGEGVQVGSPGACRIDVAEVEYDGPRSMPRERASAGTEGVRQRAQLIYPDVDPAEVVPAAGWSYTGHIGDDAKLEGTTDGDGMTSWAEAASMVSARFRAIRPVDASATTDGPSDEEQRP